MLATKNRKKDLSEMTQPEKAVAVAKDVLKHLKNIRAISGNSYIYLAEPLPLRIAEHTSGQKHIDAITSRCEVCGIGACFLSYIRLFNNATVRQVIRAYSASMIDKMQDVFSRSTLEDIERAFESEDGLKKRYRNDNQRLRAIMLNIVRNNGIFVSERYKKEVFTWVMLNLANTVCKSG